MRVTEVEEFVRNPPPGFSVETLGSGYRVRCNEEKSLVLIDDFQSCGKKIVFHNSLGRKVKMHNLWEYSSTRKSLLSKEIYLLISACEEQSSVSNKKAARELSGKCFPTHKLSSNSNYTQYKEGMDGTISSVAGESYRVDIDLTEEMESWAAKNLISDDLMKVKPVWRDASFTLKYYSDALFDFPHWLGFSKRIFKKKEQLKEIIKSSKLA
uniref:Mesenteric estrogen dependent adipogenesis n=1 Tax=Pundamilia nyererei TaxID=303518 RepID=A0A3B4G9F5_9CICH